MMVAGLGFRHGVAAEEILQLLCDAAQAASVPPERIGKLATASARSAEPGLLDAAARLRLPLAAIEPSDLQAHEGQLATNSARVRAHHGVGSVCEAAALAGAGPGARLVLARITSASAACALAEGPGA